MVQPRGVVICHNIMRSKDIVLHDLHTMIYTVYDTALCTYYTHDTIVYDISYSRTGQYTTIGMSAVFCILYCGHNYYDLKECPYCADIKYQISNIKRDTWRILSGHDQSFFGYLVGHKFIPNAEWCVHQIPNTK